MRFGWMTLVTFFICISSSLSLANAHLNLSHLPKFEPELKKFCNLRSCPLSVYSLDKREKLKFLNSTLGYKLHMIEKWQSAGVNLKFSELRRFNFECMKGKKKVLLFNSHIVSCSGQTSRSFASNRAGKRKDNLLGASDLGALMGNESPQQEIQGVVPVAEQDPSLPYSAESKKIKKEIRKKNGITGPMGPSIWDKVSRRYRQRAQFLDP